jgi:glucose/arabinose dehydrogenase/cytochrome c2
MKRTNAVLAAAISATLSATAAFAADAPAPPSPANAGKAAFRQQCALCHSAEADDGGGAQGPLLQGVFGRAAASGGNFNYTPALQASKLTWDEATLDRFLAAPATVVPGSAMVVAVPNETERKNIIAYFKEVKAGTYKEAVRPGFGGGPPPGGAPAPAAPVKGSPDWMEDVPGRMHKVDLTKLPPAFDTPSANNNPRVVAKPADAKLQVPAGFSVETFASEGLQGPREMHVAPNGDIFLVETNAGRIKVLRQGADGKLAGIDVFATGLAQPYGFQFYPETNPQWLYVAEVNRVVRYPYKSGDRVASSIPEIVVSQLSPTGGGHFTRDLQFSRDGKTMYVSVGSASNVAEAPRQANIPAPMPSKTAAEIQAWEAQKGLGAAWGTEENRAAVMMYEVGSSTAGKLFATGIRNCVSLTREPTNDNLWCSTNERDGLGDDLVPDYSTRIKPNAFYGWPWYYMGDNEDPRHAGARPDLKGKITKPDVPYMSHSAAVNLDFYTPSTGSSAFPAEYVGQGLAVLHGSWNRAYRAGGKVVQVVMKDGNPTGEYKDFLTGFVVSDGSVWGRPVALAQLQDGSLLLADDGANQIYRISYKK